MGRLVVVSGAPGSGKTTLARLIAERTGLPGLEKDRIKEALADAIGHPADVAASMRLGSAAYAALFALARDLLANGSGVIVESNFRRHVSEAELQGLAITASSARLLHCTAPESVILDRYRSRFSAGLCHPAHLDGRRHDALRADLAAGLFEPLALDWGVLVVDTESGYHPDLDHITAFAAAGD